MKNKDWKGNIKSTFVTLGASNHSEHKRAEYDFYATEPQAIDGLLSIESFEGTIWENACGNGMLSERMKEKGLKVVSTDIVDRGYGEGNIDFFQCTEMKADNIVTNPPYAHALEWVEHGLNLLQEGKKLALFLPIQFLESESRRKLFEKTPPVKVCVFSKRILCGKNGNFHQIDKSNNVVTNKNGEPKKMQSAKCYAWFIWQKGNYANKPIIEWI